MFQQDDIIKAHKAFIYNRADILRGAMCGCFHCRETYPPARIAEWTDRDAAGIARTPMCPICGMDTVLSSECGFPLTPEFLLAMRNHWFSSDASEDEEESDPEPKEQDGYR